MPPDAGQVGSTEARTGFRVGAVVWTALTEEAPVQVVVLPAKAGGAAPEVGIGYGLPGAFVAGLVAAVVGLLLLVGTVVWGRRAKRGRRTAPATAPEALAESAPAQATTVTRGATRVAAVGVIAVLAAGCSIPQQVDHGEAPGVVPLEAADAQAVLDDYDVRNNAAIKASHTGDGSRWRAADTGPVLAKDLVEAKTNAVDRPTTKAVTFTHEVEETFAAPQSAYPQWFVVSYTSSPDPESKGVGLSSRPETTSRSRGAATRRSGWTRARRRRCRPRRPRRAPTTSSAPRRSTTSTSTRGSSTQRSPRCRATPG